MWCIRTNRPFGRRRPSHHPGGAREPCFAPPNRRLCTRSVLGINIGHLGYLSELEVEDMEEYLKKIVEETTLMTRG